MVAKRFLSNFNVFLVYIREIVCHFQFRREFHHLIFFLQNKVFCLEHRTYKAHSCPKSEHNSRMVVICERCSMSIEKKFREDEKAVLARHEKSGTCDPAKKQKPRCPVKRCKEVLTFSNCNTCKKCSLKVCLKHRFPSDHQCKGAVAAGAKLPVKLPVRTSLNCREKGGLRSPPPSVKAYWLGLCSYNWLVCVCACVHYYFFTTMYDTIGNLRCKIIFVKCKKTLTICCHNELVKYEQSPARYYPHTGMHNLCIRVSFYTDWN